MEWVQLGVTAVVSVVGSGLGTTIVGLLFKRRIDHELETQKAFLHRASQVHARQVDALNTLYRHFTEAQAFIQLMASSFRLSGENPEEYPRRFAAAISASREQFFASRLLFPAELAQQCDAFFGALFKGHMELGFANDPLMFQGLQRAEVWDRAKAIAYNEIPQLLSEIERVARRVIHGESSTGNQ